MPRNAVISPSRCICQLFGICRMECGVMVVMERLKCSVHELIHNPDFCLTVPLCLQISHEIAIGIAFLHRNNVMTARARARTRPTATTATSMACLTTATTFSEHRRCSRGGPRPHGALTLCVPLGFVLRV